MCWLLSMCFVWPLKVLQSDPVPGIAFIGLSAEADCPLRGVLSKQHCFGAFFPLERDRPLATWVGSFGRWDTAVAAGALEMFLSRSRLHHPGSDPGNGLSMYCAAKEPFHVPGSLLYLLLEVLCPVSSSGGKKKKKKRCSEVEENIPGAAGWAALLYFLHTEIIVA